MNAPEIYKDRCPVCKEGLEDGSDVVQIRQKGADGINAASVQRDDDVHVAAGCKVHTDCRKRYINQHDILNQKKKQEPSKPSMKRSSRVLTGPFNSKSDCLFCGTTVRLGSFDYSHVKTDDFTKTILECCENRTDDWSFTVKGGIECYGRDLHAADYIYHHQCSVHLRTGRDVPVHFRSGPDSTIRKSGRPRDSDQEQAFSRMCSYFEMNDEEQMTISYLRGKMEEFLTEENSLPYTSYYLKKKMVERYGNSVYIAEGDGLNDIVTFREKTSHILQSFYKDAQREVDEESQKKAIIETAARLIKSDIKTGAPSVTDHYPKSEELELDSALAFLPDALRNMLNCLFVGKTRNIKWLVLDKLLYKQSDLGLSLHHSRLVSLCRFITYIGQNSLWKHCAIWGTARHMLKYCGLKRMLQAVSLPICYLKKQVFLTYRYQCCLPVTM